jgi:RecA-family ATPase
VRFFVCSMSNEGRGRPVSLLTDSTGQLEKFAEDHDQPGRSVYACVNPLRATATRRCREEVACIVTLHVDIDFKRLCTPPDEVRAKVRSLPLPFEIRESGGGLHVLANLKEAYENGTEHYQRAEVLRTQLTELLCGDPAPNHSAAILRVVGSHNSKYGEPVEVECVVGGELVDLTDIEAFLELYAARPLFEVKEEYASAVADNVVDLDTPYRPIDHDAVLADMPASGEGINAVAPRLLRALVIREGLTPDEAVECVADGVMATAARHRLADAGGHVWTREAEVRFTIPRMTWVLNRLQAEHWKAVDAGHMSADTPPTWLWGDELGKWGDVCAAGLRPQIFRNGSGWFVRRPPHSAAKADKKEEEVTLKKPALGALPSLEFIKAFDITTIPAREWYLGKQYQRGAVSGTMAPGGRGKSSLALVEAVSMATGRKLLNEAPLRRLKVWYPNGEETWDELLRRLGAVRQHYAIPTAELEGWLCMTNPQRFPLRVAEGYDKFVPRRDLIAHMRSEIERNGFEVATFDPLITVHGVHESNTVLMRGVMDIFRDLAAEMDCSVEVVGHTRKPLPGSESELSVHDTRGASSITDALRSVRMLDVMTEKEAERAEIDDVERTQYVGIAAPKRNYSAENKPPDWIRIQSVPLPNGDDVGVVTPWTWPVKDAAAAADADKRAENIFIEAAVRLSGMGRRLSDRPGMNYAPSLIAKEPEAKRAKVRKAALESAMKRLIEQNRIEPVDEGRGGRAFHELRVL